MKYKRVSSEHEDFYMDWLCDVQQCEQCVRRRKSIRFSAYLIKSLAMRSMAALCHLLCGTLLMVKEN